MKILRYGIHSREVYQSVGEHTSEKRLRSLNTNIVQVLSDLVVLSKSGFESTCVATEDFFLHIVVAASRK